MVFQRFTTVKMIKLGFLMYKILPLINVVHNAKKRSE
jgi:hypothetical protein